MKSLNFSLVIDRRKNGRPTSRPCLIWIWVMLLLLTVPNFTIKLTEAKPKLVKAACNTGEKRLITPVLPPFPKKGTRSSWKMCCHDNDLGNSENVNLNYVWVIESLEKMYFFVTGMSMLLQSSIGMFKLVEPNVCENALSSTGVPLSQFMTFGVGEIVPRRIWQQVSNQEDDKSRVNVFYLDMYQLSPNEERFPCDMSEEDSSSDKFCYQIITSRRGNRFQIMFAHNAILGKQTFNKIFKLIRGSDEAIKLGITAETVVTLGLYDQWHHLLYTSGMIRATEADYGKIFPSKYIRDAAKIILMENDSQRVSSGVVDTVISWRMQKQFFAAGRHIYGKIRSDLTFYSDKGGFVVGCQLGHLVRSLNRKSNDNTPVALLFDIFANQGLGSGREVTDGIEVGPTKNVRKLVVRALKKILKKVVIVEAMLQKMDASSIQKADPMGIINTDRQTFITWVEVSIAFDARRLVHAGNIEFDIIYSPRSYLFLLAPVYRRSFC